MKTLTIRLSDELHRAIKIRMAETEDTIQRLVIRLLEEELKKAKDKK